MPSMRELAAHRTAEGYAAALRELVRRDGGDPEEIEVIVGADAARVAGDPPPHGPAAIVRCAFYPVMHADRVETSFLDHPVAYTRYVGVRVESVREGLVGFFLDAW
jgi:hypothetical protein